MPDPGKPPRLPPEEPSFEIEPDTAQNAVPARLPHSPPPIQRVPPPPPRPRRTTAPPPPPPAPSGARVRRDSAESVKAETLQRAKVDTPPRRAPPSDVDLWRQEVAVLEREAEAWRTRDPNRAALLQGAIAALASSVLGDAPQAAAALQAASELGRDRWIAMLSRREAIGARQWPRALTLMRAELPQVGDPRERVALLLEIATVEELVRGDRPAARHALEEAREIDPAHAGVLEALGQIYRTDKEWDRLVQARAAMADATVDVEHRSMLRHSAGLIQEIALANPSSARSSYKIALIDEPANLPAAISQESLALQQEDWVGLARTLMSEAELVGEPRTVRRLCERAGDLYWERLADAEGAVTAFRRAAQATPDEVAPLRKLSGVLESTGRWRELVDVYLAELPLTRDPEERADLYFRIGEVHETNLGRVDDAVAAYRAALEAVPTHLPTLQALGALYRATERFGELAEMDLREAEKIADPTRRAERYYEVAELVERRIGDLAEAVRLYERSFDLAPGQRAAFDALDRLYRREERWGDVVALYERQSQATRDPALTRLFKQEAGRLWRDRVPNAEKSAAALREALAIEAIDLGPIVLLAHVLEAAQKWEPLVAVLEQLSGMLHDEADLIGTYHRMARVLEGRLGHEERALQAHARVLERQAGNEVSLRAVGRLHYRAGRWLEVISCYGRQLDQCETADERAATYYRIGRIYERKLGRRDDAIAAFEVALDQSAAYAPAFRALDRILRRDRLWPRLLEVLEKQAHGARTPLYRAQIHHAVGQVHELHLRDLDAAERAYTQAVELEPTFEAAVAALAQVREAKGDWRGLDALYTELLSRTSDPNARVSLLSRLGAVCEFRLADPGRAALLYRDAIEASPLGRTLAVAELRAVREDAGPAATVRSLASVGARTADTRLAHGYRTLAALRDEVSAQRPASTLFVDAAALGLNDPGVTDGVIRALSRQVPADNPDERLPTALTERARSCDSAQLKALLLLEAAFLFDRLGRVRDAALAYEEAGRALPDFLPVVRGIRRIAVAGAEWQAASALYAHEAEVAADPENRAESLLAAGELALARQNDPRAALLRYRRLLDLQPENERAYTRATALYERLDDHGGLLDLLTARAAAITDPHARAALLRRQAELQRDHLKDARAAVATLKEAIALNPGDLDALLVLAPLEEEQRWWQDAADHYRQVAELAAGTDTSRSARLKEAEIRERELGDREAARLILEELVVDPEDREAARYMALLCERMGRWDRARELYRQLAKTKKTTDRADALVALAAVMEIGFSDGDSAARALEEAFTIALGDPEVVRLLEKRFQASGDWRTFAAAGERACAKARVVAAPHVGLHLALARAYGEQLHRADLSERHLLSAASLVPHDVAPSVQLARLHMSSGRTDLALADFRRALEIDPFNAEALRGLGSAFLRDGFPDAGRLLDEVALYLEGSPQRDRTLGPLPLKRPLTPELRAQLLPRGHTAGGLAIADILKMVEPYAPALLVEATGQIPRGDELPEANQVSLRCRSVAVALGVEPLRVFVDQPDGLEALLVADARLALCIGKGLTQGAAQGRLVFEVTRRLSWIASQASVGAFLVSSELPGFLQAITQEGGTDEVKELRRRISKPLPRRLRKDAERIATEQLRDLGREAATWYAEEQRWADRTAFLLCRDPAAAFDALGGKGGKAVRQSVRAVELLRWITTEACWRAYTRLAGG